MVLDTVNISSYLEMIKKLKEQHPGSAAVFYRKAADFCRKTKPARKLLSQCFLDLTEIEAAQGNMDLALEYNDSALKYCSLYDPALLWATHMYRGNLRGSEGLFEEAMEEYMKAISLREESSEPYSLSLLYGNMI